MRVLYISGSIGLGHADRDLAIARPRTHRRCRRDVLPDCEHLDETAHAEKITSGFGFTSWARSSASDSLNVPKEVDVRGYVPNLFDHLAACDAADVQGGGTTTLELTALRRPFASFPLERHFEQEYVASRPRRHGAGVRLAFSQTTPNDLAGTIKDLLHADCAWPPIPTDGASKAAQLIMELVQPGALSRGLWWTAEGV